LPIAKLIWLLMILAGSSDYGTQGICLLPLGNSQKAVGDQSLLLSVIGQSLEKNASLSIVGPDDFRAVFAGKSPASSVKKALTIRRLDKILSSAQKAYQFLNIEKAGKALKKAKKILDDVDSSLVDSDAALKLYLLDAQVMLLAQNKRAALKSMERALSISPDLRITEEHYPPDVVEVFNKARAGLSGARIGKVKIKSRPQGALVYIDGVDRGNTPLSLNLLPGDYGMAIVKPGYERFSLKITVDAGGETARSIDLRKKGPALFSKGNLARLDRDIDPVDLDTESMGLLAKAAEDQGCSYVVMSRSIGDESSKVWMMGVEGKTILTKTWTFKGAGFFDDKAIGTASRNMAMIAVAGLDTDLEVKPGAAERGNKTATGAILITPKPGKIKTNAGEPGTKWYKSWWFWVPVGGAVLATVAGVTTWALWPKEPESAATILIGPGGQ